MREVQMKRVSHRQLILPAIAALIAAGYGLISPGNAQTFGSSYTSTAPKDCRTIGKPENGSTTLVCPGKSGLVVLTSEDDLRQIRPRRPGLPPSIPPPTPSNGGRWTASRSRSFNAG
jgi:hypothetical protein